MLKKIVILAFIFSASFLIINDDVKAKESDKLLAHFIINLIDYMKWDDLQELKICAYGYDGVTQNLSKINTQDLSVGWLSGIEKIEFLDHVAFEALDACNVIYVARDKEKNVYHLLEMTAQKPIITISTIDDFAESGGIFELKLVRRKVKLKLDDIALAKTNISLSPMVLMSMSPELRKTFHYAGN